MLGIFFVKLINIHGSRGDTSLKKECNCIPLIQTYKQSLSPHLKSQISNLKSQMVDCHAFKVHIQGGRDTPQDTELFVDILFKYRYSLWVLG